jgi:hypothetical protein
MTAVEITTLLLRVARAFGWDRGVQTASYVSVTRGDDRLAFAVNLDGTLTVSVGGGGHFTAVTPLGAVGLLP